MSAVTVPAAAPRAARPGHKVTLAGVLRSEAIKLRTVRSTVWTLATTVVLMVGVSVLIAWGSTMGAEGGAEAGPPGPLAELLTLPYFFAQLPVVVLGVLTVTGEYSTGMVRSSFAAVPRRLPVLAAKAAVLAVTVAVTTVVALALSYVATMPWHDELGVSLDLGDPESQRLLVGMVLYLTTIALLAVAVGALLRHSAGAIAAIVGLLLVVENVFSLIPLRFFQEVSPFLPSRAGSLLLMSDESIAGMQAGAVGADLTPWQGYGVLVAWVLVLGAAAMVLLRRRDA